MVSYIDVVRNTMNKAKSYNKMGIIYLLSPIILLDKYTHIYEKVCMIVWKYGLGELYLQK